MTDEIPDRRDAYDRADMATACVIGFLAGILFSVAFVVVAMAAS